MNGLKKAAAVCVASAGVAAVSCGLCNLSYELLFNRHFVPPEKISFSLINCDSESLAGFVEENIRWVENYGYEKHKIINDSGMALAGRLLRPEKESDVYVFGIHGYRGNGKRLGGMARYYIGKGYNVFLPDHRASGESEGKYCTIGYHEKDDCFRWLDYMTETFGEDIKIILHGVSMGASIALLMAGDKKLPDNVKFIVEDSGFTDLTELLTVKFSKSKIVSKSILKILNSINKRKCGFDISEVSPVESVRRSETPILFIHGKEDGLIPSDMAVQLYEACRSEKKLMLIEGANHAQNLKIGGDKYFSGIDSFIERYL